MTDPLLTRAAAGDPAAVRALLDQVGPAVFGFVLARVGGDRVIADDIVQDTLVEGLKSAATFRGDAALSTWMCSIARRRIARHFAAERRLSGGWPASEEPTTESAEEIVGDRDEVVRALGRLPALYRQVLVLKYLDDLPVIAIAEELDRTAVQVQSLLQRARVALRRELGGTR